MVSAPNPVLALLPGMTASVRIVTDQKIEVLKIPNAATEQGSRAAALDPRAGQVWVLGADDTPQSVSVRLGASDGAFTEVQAGALGEHQRVIVGSTSPSSAAPPGGLRLRF